MPPLVFDLFEYIIANYHTINSLAINATEMNLFNWPQDFREFNSEND